MEINVSASFTNANGVMFFLIIPFKLWKNNVAHINSRKAILVIRIHYCFEIITLYDVINHLLETVKSTLLHTFNRVLKNYPTPENWKKHIVILLTESQGSPYTSKRFKPIALTSFECKILKSIIKLRLEWIENKNILSLLQWDIIENIKLLNIKHMFLPPSTT